MARKSTAPAGTGAEPKKLLSTIVSDAGMGINGIPVGRWALTPTNGKRPYRRSWQTEPPLDLAAIEGELRAGNATGYGVRLGRV
ncbi:MAG: hypothetical protein ONB06_08545, partial [candidate division KSB1 bacterium]|nr:hypothetical protein [candidate division KSB1 bacterium]